MDKDVKAASFKVNYKDKKYEEAPIIALVDIIDWWEPHHEPGNVEKHIVDEKIGYLGQNQEGQMRVLTKPFWVNPYPEKEISHIDFITGNAKGSPFLIAITLE